MEKNLNEQKIHTLYLAKAFNQDVMAKLKIVFEGKPFLISENGKTFDEVIVFKNKMMTAFETNEPYGCSNIGYHVLEKIILGEYTPTLK